MYDRNAIERARQLQAAWEGNELRGFLQRQPETVTEARTLSGLPVQRVYTGNFRSSIVSRIAVPAAASPPGESMSSDSSASITSGRTSSP